MSSEEQHSVRYLPHHDIDKYLWDRRIDTASNGLVYAYSFYLDGMTDNWDAIVMNDYEAVMPLPWRIKFGTAYLYHPFLTAQLGIFGNELTAVLVKTFLNTIPKKFRYWDFPLNYKNLFVGTGYPLYVRNNLVLSLNKPHKALQNNYKGNTRRISSKAVENGCRIERNIAITAIMDLSQKQVKQICKSDWHRLEQLYAELSKRRMAETYGAFSTDGKLLSSAVFFLSHQRAYYVLAGNDPASRSMGASHALIDAFIRDHAEQDLLLDFEGSDIEGVAFFFRSFGANEEKYPAIRLNRLPWWLRLIKR